MCIFKPFWKRKFYNEEKGKTRIKFKIFDEQILEEIAYHGARTNFRAEAAGKLTDPTVLAELIKDKDWHVACSAISNPAMTDQKLLAEIATSSPIGLERICAVEKLENRELATRIKLIDKDWTVRFDTIFHAFLKMESISID